MPQLITDPLRTRGLNGNQTDRDLLRSLRWTAGPEQLVAAARRGDAAAFANEVAREFRHRFGRKGGDSTRLAMRFPLAGAIARDAYGGFAQTTPEPLAAPDEPINRLVRLAALLDGLRRFGGRLDADSLWPLWREAWTETSQLSRTSRSNVSPLATVLTAECLWAAAIIFEGNSGAGTRQKTARERLRAELEARTDTDGAPHAEVLPVLPAWFASLVRSASWAKVGDVRLWNADLSDRFDGLVRAAALLTRPDGRLSLSPPADLRPILAEAVKRSGWKASSSVRRFVTRLRPNDGRNSTRPTGEAKPRKPDKTSPPVVQSDWADLAIARTIWRPDADGFAVAHHGATPAMEFLAFGRSVFAGDWGLRVRIDDQELVPTADWEAVSWFSDKDADYLELQWPNEQGVVVCRQLLLTRGDHQLVVADCVSTPGRPATRIEVDTILPLAAGVTAANQRPLREVRLDADGLPLRCFPVSLPMDRVESAAGSLEPKDERLVLRQADIGGVYAPVVVDWHPRRRDALADWRTLTVTEDHRRLGPAEASGHRLRIGGRQLLLYRGLDGSKAMRALLGHHHGHESVIGRFTAKGEVEPLVLVE